MQELGGAVTVTFLRLSVEKETALTGATEQKSKVVTWWPRDRLLRRASRVYTGAAHQSAGACRQVAADGRWVSCQFALFPRKTPYGEHLGTFKFQVSTLKSENKLVVVL